jgi:5-methylcytosine-specific restriction endonuclease McrA
MSGPVFVLDAAGTPLMPMSPAHARKLVNQQKAQVVPHYQFHIIQLSQAVAQPQLNAVVALIRVHALTAELIIVADGAQRAYPLLRILIDLRTDLALRLRRRAGFRRRRRSRQRYRAPRRHAVPFKARRPAMRRSTWRQQLRRRSRQPSRRRAKTRVPPTIRWRSEAIERVCRTLQRFLPISHIIIADQPIAEVPDTLAVQERRAQLIAAYGIRDPQGKLVPRCMYCGTTEGRIEIDHIVPRSRGGTWRWDNLALACVDCNERKGRRTAHEAGMSLQQLPSVTPMRLLRQQSLIYQTNRRLKRILSRQMTVHLGTADTADWPEVSRHLGQMLAMGQEHPEIAALTTIIAYPVPRQRKQRYTGRNYPAGAAGQRGYEQIGSTVKRRVRINSHLVIRDNDIIVHPTDQASDTDGIIVRIGMLCEATRAGVRYTGIVSAIHSSGRVTLRVAAPSSIEQVRWQRIVVSPRRLQVVSRDRVVFFDAEME